MMRDQDVGMLPVIENDGSKRLVGVVTDRDIAIRHVAEGHGSSDCQVKRSDERQRHHRPPARTSTT
jgi:predicted transcriptional regulator